MKAQSILKKMGKPFSDTIAASVDTGSFGFDEMYRLRKVEDGISYCMPEIRVYVHVDTCFITGDALPDAYDVSQFDVHRIVSRLIDETEYVLRHVDTEMLSREQAEQIGLDLEVEEDG